MSTTPDIILCECGEEGDPQGGNKYVCGECGNIFYVWPDKSRKERKKKSQKQERATAKAMGGRAQPGSGAIPGFKGDVLVQGKERVECKYTESKQYTLKQSDLKKVELESSGKEMPVFQIEFKTVKESYAILRWDDYMELREAATHG